MKLTPKALQEFQKIWQEENPGDTVSWEELEDVARRMMRIVEILIYKR